MDVVYASLFRRQPAEPASPGEVAEVLGAVWAHATPNDGLDHTSGRAEANRIDLLFYLITQAAGPGDPGAPDAVHRTEALLMRCYRASPLVRRRYLPPRGASSAPGP